MSSFKYGIGAVGGWTDMRVIVGAGLTIPIIISALLKYIQGLGRKSHIAIPSVGTNDSNEKQISKEVEIRPVNITPEDVATYHERPWRPFRWPHNQTMALVKLDINYWFDITPHYKKFMRDRRELFQNYDKEKLKTSEYYFAVEGFEDELIELRDYAISLLCKRYPLLFTRNKNIVENKITNEIIDLDQVEPLIATTMLTMEDFYVVQKKEDGLNYCIGASVTFAGGGFGVSPLKNQPIDIIHANVPYYTTKLKPSMEKWFAKFTDPVERCAWHLVWDENLNCSELYPTTRNLDHDAAKAYIESIPYEKWSARLEQQTLVKLPESKAIIFSNHPKFIYLSDLADEPMMPSLILKMLYEAPEDIIKYKHFEAVRDYISIYLNQMIDEQIKKGLIEKDAKVRTQDHYPWAHWMNSVFESEEKGWPKPAPN